MNNTTIDNSRLDTFENKLKDWNNSGKADDTSPWEYMGIEKDLYYELLVDLSQRQYKQQLNCEKGLQEEYPHIDAMSIVYFVLLLCVGTTAFFIAVLCLKAFL